VGEHVGQSVISEEKFFETPAYDGQLSAMTFNIVKSSKAFDVKSKRAQNLFDITEEEEDLSWLNPSDKHGATR